MEFVTAAESWIKYDYEQKDKFVKELIKQVRLPLLSKACLENLLADNSSFSNCNDSKRQKNNSVDNNSIDTYD